jgi:hypothetical protein
LASIQVPQRHSYLLELSLCPATKCGIEVVPNLLHLLWKEHTRSDKFPQQPMDLLQAPVKAHEWRLMLKKEGNKIQR